MGRTLETIKNDVVAHFNDRVQSLEVHPHPTSGKTTLVAVVDALDRNIDSKMHDLIGDNTAEQASSIQLELLDQQTYALLQRLAEAGVITINGGEGSRSLYRSPVADRLHQTKNSNGWRKLRNAWRRLKENAHGSIVSDGAICYRSATGSLTEEAAQSLMEAALLCMDPNSSQEPNSIASFILKYIYEIIETRGVNHGNKNFGI